jgi:hypothetical protein
MVDKLLLGEGFLGLLPFYCHSAQFFQIFGISEEGGGGWWFETGIILGDIIVDT